MKRLLFIISVSLISLSAFSQQKDTVITKLELNTFDLRSIYAALDNAHGDHVEIKRMLEYINSEYNKQHPPVQPKTDSTGKK